VTPAVLKGVLEYGEELCEWGAIEGLRTQRNNNLDARSALLFAFGPPWTKGLTSVTTCHISSHSVTLCHNCDTRSVAVKRWRSLACVIWANWKSAAWYHKCRGCFEPDSSTNVTRTETDFEKTGSTVRIIDDAGQCAESLGIKINTLYVMKSQGRIPYRKVGHLLRFDFDEIVEWTKEKEK
jgi:excisionase family DNA binding protein